MRIAGGLPWRRFSWRGCRRRGGRRVGKRDQTGPARADHRQNQDSDDTASCHAPTHRRSTARRRRPDRRRNDRFRFRRRARPHRGLFPAHRRHSGCAPQRCRNGIRPRRFRRRGHRRLLLGRLRGLLDDRRQRLGHLDGLLITPGRLLGQHLRRHRGQLRRRLRTQLAQGRRLHRCMRLQDRVMALARERRGAGQQEVERAAEAVDVAADVGARCVPRLLRRHVGRRAQHCPCRG